MLVKITDIERQAVWVNMDLLVGVIVPSPLSVKATECRVVLQGMVIPVSHEEARRVVGALNGEVEHDRESRPHLVGGNGSVS